METFFAKTDLELAAEIVTWSGRIAAGEAHLVALIGEFDEREAWVGHGLLSCAHWLSWQVGLGLNAARERVRVARRLRQLPEVAEAFAAGRMSWCQVRAVTRVASTEDGIDWVGLARDASGAQLERIVRGLRRVERIAEAEADPEGERYRMRSTMSYDADGTMVFTIRVAAQDGVVIRAGLDAMRAQIDRRRRDEQAVDQRTAQVSAETPRAFPRKRRLRFPRQRPMTFPRKRQSRTRLKPRRSPTRCSSWPGQRWNGSTPSIPRSLAGPGRSSPHRSTRCRGGDGCTTASSSRPRPSSRSRGACREPVRSWHYGRAT